MRRWNRGEKIGAVALVAAFAALPAAYLVVPEVRRFFRLEREPMPFTNPVTTSSVSSVPKTGNKTVGVFARSVGELRKSNSVTRMEETESGKPLREIPLGSFGFANPIDLRYSVEDLRLQPYSPEDRFEVHNLPNGEVELLGYVGPETLQRVRSGLSHGEAITFFSDRWMAASNLVAVPLGRFDCPRERIVPLDEPNQKSRRILSALDCKTK
jgi:hypothetical protein